MPRGEGVAAVVKVVVMTDVTTIERDTKSGRFIAGNSGNGGRKPGARNKLGEAFLEDLRDSWNESGAVALRRCADEDPAAYCRIVASLLPRDLNLNLTLDATAFADRWRQASELLGHEVAPPMPRRSLRTVAALPSSARTATKVIEP
jgi:hypothetical protein